MSLCFAHFGVRVRRFVMGGALLTAAAVALALPATSNASACGIQYFGTHQFNGYTIPSGQLMHCISGSGYHVSWDGANFASAGNLCDASIEFTYGYGRWYLKSSVHRGCSTNVSMPSSAFVFADSAFHSNSRMSSS